MLWHMFVVVIDCFVFLFQLADRNFVYEFLAAYLYNAVFCDSLTTKVHFDVLASKMSTKSSLVHEMQNSNSNSFLRRLTITIGIHIVQQK